MAMTPGELHREQLEFLQERAYATLTTLRRDGSPHVVPVGFTWWPDEAMALICVPAVSQKTTNAARGGAAALCQAAGHRWLTLEGQLVLHRSHDWVERAVDGYRQRYGRIGNTRERAVIALHVDRILTPAFGPLSPDPQATPLRG